VHTLVLIGASLHTPHCNHRIRDKMKVLATIF